MALVGTGGSVYLGANKVGEIQNWSLDLGAETPETTSFDSAGWKTFIAGLKEWSGSMEGNWIVNTDTNGQTAIQNAWLAGTTLTVSLRVNAVPAAYGGSILITGLSINTPVDDKIDFGVEFQGTGPLAYT